MTDYDKPVMLARSGGTLHLDSGAPSPPASNAWSSGAREIELFDAASMSTVVSQDVTERTVPSFPSGSIIDTWDDTEDEIPGSSLVEAVRVRRTVLFSEEHVITPSKLPRRGPRINLDLDFLDSVEDD
jgi:hypothetical protein